MNVGSLFSGIGGFDLGFERAGMRTSWFCEQDDYCRRVLNRHWPDVPVYPDVTELRGADVEPVDVLCGGFPCQDLSYAGAGAGIAGARSGLWSEYARLIDELRPRYVVVENVTALLRRGLGTVLGDLHSLGFDAEWDCIPASAFGAPHRRDRVWLVAYPHSKSEPHGPVHEEASGHGEASGRTPDLDDAAGKPERESANQAHPVAEGRQAWDEPVYGGELVAHPAGVGQPRPGQSEQPQHPAEESYGEAVEPWDGGSPDIWSIEPNVGRVADGVPARMDRLSALGNALVPQIAEWIGRRIMTYEANQAAVAAPKKEAA